MKRPVNPEETQPRALHRDRAKPAPSAGRHRISAETSVNAITDITCAYLANPNNSTSLAELPQVIQTVQDHVRNLILTVSTDSTSDINSLIGMPQSGVPATELANGSPLSPAGEPAVPISQSITDDYIICLEDGKKFKSLRRHLERCYGLTPEQYRSRWGLPSDYPMTSPNYHATRSKLARQNGFGRSEPLTPDTLPGKPKPKGRMRGG